MTPLETIKAAIDAAEAREQWHPASEPPTHNKIVLTQYMTLLQIASYETETTRWVFEDGTDTDGADITHWRELPAGPGEGSTALARALRLAVEYLDSLAMELEFHGMESARIRETLASVAAELGGMK